jgi:secreted trypsin-like serine protease
MPYAVSLKHRATRVGLALVLVSLLSGCGSSSTASNGGSESQPDFSSIETRIVDGNLVGREQAPQVVSVTTYFIGGGIEHCSGTLLAPDAVLTAAHCFGPGAVKVTVDSVSGTADARAIIKHPGFREEPVALFNDIAIVRLQTRLPTPVMPIFAGTPPQSEALLTLGYGLAEDGSSGILRAGLTRLTEVTVNHLIAAPDQGMPADPCNGDSGGPAIITIQSPAGNVSAVAAIVSSGSTLVCGAGDTTFFTNTMSGERLDFIRATVPEAVVFQLG